MNDINQAADRIESVRSGNITTDSQKRFWGELAKGEAGGTNAATVLMAYLAAIETGEDASTSLSDLVKKINAAPASSRANVSGEAAQTRDSLVLALHFLLLFRAYNVSSVSLRAATNKLTQVRCSTEMQPLVDTLVAAFSSNQNEASIVNYVNQCAVIELPLNPTLPNISPRYTSPSFVHSLLMQLSRTKRYGNLIVDSIVQQLRQTDLSEKRVLVLLHMLSTTVSASPVINIDLLNNALQTVKPYYLRPRPVGVVAQRLLRLLSLESGAPGAALRSLCDMSAKALKERTVHVLVPPGARERRFCEALRASQERDTPTRALQQMLLVSIFQRVLGLDLAGVLASAAPQVVAQTYTQAVEVLEQSVLRVGSDAVNYRASQLRALSQNLKAAPGAQPVRAARGPPALHFNVVPLQLDSAVDDDIAIGDGRFPKRHNVCNALNQLLAEHLPFATPTYRPIVRLLIAGGDDALHTVTCAVVVLRLTKPKLFSDVDLRLYVVPTLLHNSGFAAYLARIDNWYGRHALLGPQAALDCWPVPPLSSNDVSAPSFASGGAQPTAVGAELGQAIANRANRIVAPPSRGNPVTANPDELWPASLMRDMLSNYARFGEHILPTTLYKCECYYRDNAPPISVPFFSRVELGQAAAARAYQKSAGLDSSLPLDEVVNAKGFKFVPPVVALAFKHMTVRGMPRDADPLRATAYHTLVLASHWQPSDSPGVPTAHCTQRWLEMFAYEVDGKKKRREPPLVHHVGQTEIEGDAKRPFDLLLDSVHYGPLVRAVIKPLDLPSDDGMFSLPVVTFNPVADDEMK